MLAGQLAGITTIKTPRKRAASSRPAKNDWAMAFRDIALKAIAGGQLVSFGILTIFAIVAYKMESADWVRIVTLFVGSPLFNVLGWMFFVGSTGGLTWLLVQQRKLYRSEIQRISQERNHWQNSNGAKEIQSSGYEALND